MPQPEFEFPPDSVMHGLQRPGAEAEPDIMPDARQLYHQGEVAEPATSAWFATGARQAVALPSPSGVAEQLIRDAGVHLEDPTLTRTSSPYF
jgi:hypothetical protein